MSLSSRCPSLRIPRRPRHSTPPSAPHCPSAQHCPRHIAEDGDHPQHSTAAYFAARVTAAWIADFRRGPSYPRRILVTSKIRILIQMLSPPRHTLNNCRIGSPPNCLHKGLRAWTWCLRGTYAKIRGPYQDKSDRVEHLGSQAGRACRAPCLFGSPLHEEAAGSTVDRVGNVASFSAFRCLSLPFAAFRRWFLCMSFTDEAVATKPQRWAHGDWPGSVQLPPPKIVLIRACLYACSACTDFALKSAALI